MPYFTSGYLLHYNIKDTKRIWEKEKNRQRKKRNGEKNRRNYAKRLTGFCGGFIMEKTGAYLKNAFCKMVCRLQKGFFRHALRKETTGRPADRLRQNKAVAEKKTAGSGGLK